jgi:hypothetical protein
VRVTNASKIELKNNEIMQVNDEGMACVETYFGIHNITTLMKRIAVVLGRKIQFYFCYLNNRKLLSNNTVCNVKNFIKSYLS